MQSKTVQLGVVWQTLRAGVDLTAFAARFAFERNPNLHLNPAHSTMRSHRLPRFCRVSHKSFENPKVQPVVTVLHTFSKSPVRNCSSTQSLREQTQHC